MHFLLRVFMKQVKQNNTLQNFKLNTMKILKNNEFCCTKYASFYRL